MQMRSCDLRWGAKRCELFCTTNWAASPSTTTRGRIPLRFCPGRLEKAQVVEALQEAALFVIDGPEPTPERIFDSMYMRGDQKE